MNEPVWLETIRNPEATIKEIDVTSKKRFTDAFKLADAGFLERFKEAYPCGSLSSEECFTSINQHCGTVMEAIENLGSGSV